MVVKRPQGTADQKDLRDEAMKGALRHDATGDGARVGAGREPQAVAAWEQQRAFTRASDGPTLRT